MDLDRYQLVRTIASGGMGQVYEAIARGHGGFTRRVAIKRLLPELLGDDHARSLFRDEARIASHLHHGNIVQVLDYGVVDGAEFLVFEYVDGTDAHRLVNRIGPVPESIALHVIGEIAHALAYAHDSRDAEGRPLGIVHRDVSLQNILLSWEGDVKLSDFGIALAVARDSRTQTGLVKGKLGYLAKEQLDGERATAASDVYALGVSLELLIGGSDEPVSEPTRALIAACTSDDPRARPTATALARETSRMAGRVGRGELRELLQGARTTAVPRSALDDLMGMALVPVGGSTFTIARTGVDREPPEAAPSHTPAPPRRSRALAVVVVVVSLLALVGILVVVFGITSSEAPVRGVMLDEPGDARASSADVSRELLDGVEIADAMVDPIEPRVVDASVAVIPPRRIRDAGVRVRPDAAPTSSERGWIRIGGRELVNASVEIDGRSLGFAPLLRELPVGRHHLVVRAPDRGVLVDTTIEITERHTRAAPVAVLK